jgi:RNA polymerase sigma-54 factor
MIIGGERMRPRLSMKMQMRTSPQLVLAGELLRVSSAELENRIRRELEENPALEKTNHHSHWESAQKKFNSIHSRPEITALEDTLERTVIREPILARLAAQAALFVSGQDLDTVTTLLYALDAQGYLKDSPEQLTARLGLEQADVERLLPILHQLEPPGIGARDLRECLLIQAHYLQEEGVSCDLLKRVLEESWDDFAEQRWGHVARKLRVSKIEIESVHHFITQNLYPYPLGMMGEDPETPTVLHDPDLIISRRKQDGQVTFSIEIPAAEAFELRLSDGFTRAMEASTFSREEFTTTERDWLQSHLERARLFIGSLQKRWETLRRIVEYVIEYQKEFLECGPSRLKPLTQSMVARALGCHESTVSRAVNAKVVQLPNGRLAPMDVFFDASLSVKAVLRQILADSRKSISDREMTERLAQAGYFVARRTVAKYRAQINQVNSF